MPEASAGWDGRLIVSDGLVLATSPQGLFAFDAATGAARFSVPMDEVFCGLPAFTGEGSILAPFYHVDQALEIHRLRLDGGREHIWTLSPAPSRRHEEGQSLASGGTSIPLEIALDGRLVAIADDDHDIFGGDSANKLFLGPVLAEGEDFVQSWVYRQRAMHTWSPQWYAAEWACVQGGGVVLTDRAARRLDSGEILWRHDAHPLAVRDGFCLLLDRRERMAAREARVQAALEAQLDLDEYSVEAEAVHNRAHPLEVSQRLLTVTRDFGDVVSDVAIDGELVAVEMGHAATALVVAHEDGTGREIVLDRAGHTLWTGSIAGPADPLARLDAEQWPTIAGMTSDAVLWMEDDTLICRSLHGEPRWRFTLPDPGSSFSPRVADRWLAWPRFTMDGDDLWLRAGRTAWCWRIRGP